MSLESWVVYGVGECPKEPQSVDEEAPFRPTSSLDGSALHSFKASLSSCAE